jgi:23S rRNA (adenine2503-C2)-methyltransferase
LQARRFNPVHASRVIRELFECGTPTAGRRNRLPRDLSEELALSFPASSLTLARRQVSDDGTTKLLLRLQDGRSVESVLMADYRDDRASGCISSQVGCAMGCDFCATTQTGFERNLTSGEIIEQFLRLKREALAAGRTLRTIVFMGMGEPMLNLKNVLAAVQRIAAPQLGAFGWRQITISTVGIVPGIDELREAGFGVHLALSLHAPDDATRADLLPVGKRFDVTEVLSAADRYQAASGRITTVQYCLLDGVNDSLAQARDLARLLDGRRMHVNLLRYNPTGRSLRGRTYAPSSLAQTEAFLADIDAACGQLRRRAAGQHSAA